MPHFLKRLELNGFKSFGQKTVFDFPEGITAIVGPNGSGKSNIIDAIRWLLGEREAKSLRGGKGEDLIFAGTAKRARLSQAQASLHFENHLIDTAQGKQNFFPVDFPEVVVSREVRRDGVNRYFINKSEVRLKDLIDFFARARLGSRGLVVVTQGNSDMFVRATPVERREMIEEMLGLREYQLKKSEALRRLKHTQINLDKVKALTEEILPHLRSLKRQTSRWEKREGLAHELRELENQFFGSEYLTLKREMSEIEKEIHDHVAERTVLEKEKTAAEENLKRVEASQPKERRELDDARKQIQALLEKRSKFEKDLGRLEAQIEMGKHAAPAPSHGPSVHTLFDFMKRLRSKLESFHDMDLEDMHIGIAEVMEDIDELLEQKREDTLLDFAQSKAAEISLPAGLQFELTSLTNNLKTLERQIGGLRDEEKKLEKNQEQFYGDFKAAVARVEAAKDAREKWDAKDRERRFEKERVALRRAEWERQVRASERRPEEFEIRNQKAGNREHEAGNKERGTGNNEEGRADVEKKIFRLRGDLASIGEIDHALVAEARETETRYEFLEKESGDLRKAKDDLRKMIVDLRVKIQTEFAKALTNINEEFNAFFTIMFGGGTGKLKLASGIRDQELGKNETAGKGMKDLPDGENVKDAVKVQDGEEEQEEEGIEIDLKLPRKRITSLGVLSGGERSLVGIAALFSMISVSPPPFLALDEVDAPLDERNARRFSEMLKEFSKKTQFILVTHNRTTMEVADVLYGITLGEDETSKVVSLKLE